MVKQKAKSLRSKSRPLLALEYCLLIICLCVLALRVTYTENLNAQSANQSLNLADSTYSLTISAVLLFAFLVWLVVSFCGARLLYRFTAMEPGLLLFAIASIIAGLAAADKRSALTNIAMLVAPILAAVLLVQILDSKARINLVLIVIAALGVVSAYACAEQFFVTNEMTLQQYEQDPQSLLAPLGIQTGSFEHMLFEHRLYSRGIRGFFTTGNSAGSFALLAALAAVGLCTEKLNLSARRRPHAINAFYPILGTAIVAAGLAITQSKGAILAAALATAMFCLFLCFRHWLGKYKKHILLTCIALLLLGTAGVISYGLTHSRLPGGNSMLVRWQYWTSAAKMYADRPLTGVGPGNFAHFYTHYKPPGALETVTDPHNFPLSLITQYGPIGLIGFLAMIALPLYRLTTTKNSLPDSISAPQNTTKKNLGAAGIVISLAMLALRPILLPVKGIESPDVAVYVLFTLYVAPVAAFAVGLWLFADGRSQQPANNSGITEAALFCAVAGCLIHNLVDFAIFEPCIYTCFWMMVAVLVALDYQRKSRPIIAAKPGKYLKMALLAGVIAIAWAYIGFIWKPPVTSSAQIRQAAQAARSGRLETAHHLLNQAAEADRLSPAALSLNGRLYLQQFLTAHTKQTQWLYASEKCLKNAIRRNNAGYRNFERLSRVYSLLAEQTDWKSENAQIRLQKAHASANEAVRRYPGCGRLRIRLAQTAEQLGKTDIALIQYKQAIEIEDAYRRQFQEMYPRREMFSRLGKENYELALKRVKELSPTSQGGG